MPAAPPTAHAAPVWSPMPPDVQVVRVLRPEECDLPIAEELAA